MQITGVVGDQNDVPVLVSLNGADFVGADLFAYYETLSVTSIFHNGPETGNTRIKVLGLILKIPRAYCVNLVGLVLQHADIRKLTLH